MESRSGSEPLIFRTTPKTEVIQHSSLIVVAAGKSCGQVCQRGFVLVSYTTHREFENSSCKPNEKSCLHVKYRLHMSNLSLFVWLSLSLCLSVSLSFSASL